MATPKGKTELQTLSFSSSDEWNAWLVSHSGNSPGLWLKLAKKGSGIESVTKKEAIDLALCHGWIDGQLKPLDTKYWLIRFTPRRPGSNWSKINRERAAELIEDGRMQKAGLLAIERAKADGRWAAAYASQSAAIVPDDLSASLESNTKAKRHFEQLDARNRYAIIYRIHNIKKPETRKRRIEEYVSMLARGDSIYPKK